MKYGQSSTFGGEFKGRWCLPGTLTSLFKDGYTPVGEGGGGGGEEREGEEREGEEREGEEREGEGRERKRG